MGFIKEFKEFISRGNVVDLTVGVIIGAAFSKIITSLVADVVMPLINPLIPGGDWRKLEVWNGIKIGSFLGNLLDFLIMALMVFLMVKLIRSIHKEKKAEAPPPEPTQEEILLTEIRDTLREKRN
jgi:large conductance mechanosensitive channel